MSNALKYHVYTNEANLTIRLDNQLKIKNEKRNKTRFA